MPKFNVEAHFEVEAESADEAFEIVVKTLNAAYEEGRLPGHYELLEGAATCQTGEYSENLLCTNCHVHLYEHD